MNVFQLHKAMPLAPALWLDALVNGCDKWGINTDVRRAAFIGHLAHECTQFTHLEENLSCTAERLTEVWPRRFPTLEAATPYARNPQKLANKVYANRLGNGDEASGDGWMFCGCGPIQVTGFNNYKKVGEAIGVDLISNPRKLLSPPIGVAAAGHFWQSHGLNELADEGIDGLVHSVALPLGEMDDELAVTRAINGGETGYYARIDWITKIRKELM